MEQLLKLIDVISNSSAALTLTILGFILLFAGMTSLSRIVTLKPEETPNWLVRLTQFCFGVGIILSSAGPGYALFNVASHPIHIRSSDAAWADLKTNREVKWVVRLIAYDPETQKELSIGKVKRVGPDDKEYTFVGVYDDLKGYKVKEALELVGAEVPKKLNFRTSAMIFPVTMPIIPANARGLLQVVQEIEERHPEFKNKIATSNNFAESDLSQLKNVQNMGSWSFDELQNNYSKYCRLAYKAICEHFDAIKLISNIGLDWHPVGGTVISKAKKNVNHCSNGYQNFCARDKWDQIAAEIQNNNHDAKFGARIFFIKNTDLDQIDNRYLIDFGNPDQLIPEIGD